MFASSCCNAWPPIWPRLFENSVFERHRELSVPPSLSLELWINHFDPHTGRVLRVLERQEKRRPHSPASAVSQKKNPPAGLPGVKSTLGRGRTIVLVQNKLERALPFPHVMWCLLNIEPGSCGSQLGAGMFPPSANLPAWLGGVEWAPGVVPSPQELSLSGGQICTLFPAEPCALACI